jgi:hypothetical protein
MKNNQIKKCSFQCFNLNIDKILILEFISKIYKFKCINLCNKSKNNINKNYKENQKNKLLHKSIQFIDIFFTDKIIKIVKIKYLRFRLRINQLKNIFKCKKIINQNYWLKVSGSRLS